MLRGVVTRPLTLRTKMVDRLCRNFFLARADVAVKLNSVVHYFAIGYNSAFDPLPKIGLSGVPPEFRGFAVEGAAMSAVLVDLLTVAHGRR